MFCAASQPGDYVLLVWGCVQQECPLLDMAKYQRASRNDVEKREISDEGIQMLTA
jgi:hypothetical protein